MNPLLSARGLSHRFGAQTVFTGIDLCVNAGDRIAVLGASGSGKTTLLRILARLTSPTEGVLECADDLTIGMVFQDLALWPNLSAADNAALALHSLPRKARADAARSALAACRVGDLAERLPHTLSVGQQQRVALARAIAVRPKLLLLDEPFSNLDLIVKADLLETVSEVTRDCGLIFVTHDPSDALALCQSALVLEAGRSIECGLLRELLLAPRSRLLRMFQNARAARPI